MITEAGLVVGEGYRRGVVTGGKDEEREDGEGPSCERNDIELYKLAMNKRLQYITWPTPTPS